MMTQRLSLTDAENSQIKPIVQSSVEQFQKDMEAQKAAHQKMIDDAKAKVRAVLTPDQQKQFDAMTAMLGGPPAAPAPAAK
jgi:Spy/CpxP family protein refolding chaperone